MKTFVANVKQSIGISFVGILILNQKKKLQKSFCSPVSNFLENYFIMKFPVFQKYCNK